jgi:hypothetical protein
MPSPCMLDPCSLHLLGQESAEAMSKNHAEEMQLVSECCGRFYWTIDVSDGSKKLCTLQNED